MTETLNLTIFIAVVSVLFIGEAMRRGLGRALAAMGVMGLWLGVTLAVLRNGAVRGGVAALRDYVIVMSLSLVIYFGGIRWLIARSGATTKSGPERPGHTDSV
jgi:hypothetical protein